MWPVPKSLATGFLTSGISGECLPGPVCVLYHCSPAHIRQASKTATTSQKKKGRKKKRTDERPQRPTGIFPEAQQPSNVACNCLFGRGGLLSVSVHNHVAAFHLQTNSLDRSEFSPQKPSIDSIQVQHAPHGPALDLFIPCPLLEAVDVYSSPLSTQPPSPRPYHCMSQVDNARHRYNRYLHPHSSTNTARDTTHRRG